MKRIPLYMELPEYTQAEEDALAVELAGQPANLVPILFNTALSFSRRWTGSAFESVVPIAPGIVPLVTTTAQGVVPPTGTPSGKFLKDDLTWAAAAGAAAWGSVTGTLSDQTDLQAELDGKSATSHTHTGVYEPANANIQAHVASAHAPSNAQANADITKAEIEAKLTGVISSHSHAGGGGAEPWEGVVVGCFSNGDPHLMLNRMLHNPLNATPTNIGTTVARCAYFRLKTAITVANIRFFGVGATTGVYHVAIYRHSDLARLTADLSPNTAAQTWGVAAVAGGVTLAADTLYFIAVSVDTTGTTAGMQCCSGTTGRIGVLPASWPGSLDIDKASPAINAGFCQFAVTAGALPNPAATLAAQAAWTGGMPAIFLDSL